MDVETSLLINYTNQPTGFIMTAGLVKMKNRITCQRALFHKWIQVCDWIKGGKFMFNVQFAKQDQRRIRNPVKQSMMKVFCENLAIFVKKPLTLRCFKGY